MNGRLIWMLRRLRVMSAAEIGWRATQALRLQAERAGGLRASATPRLMPAKLPGLPC